MYYYLEIYNSLLRLGKVLSHEIIAMSFGFAIADFVALGTLVSKLYKGRKGALAYFLEFEKSSSLCIPLFARFEKRLRSCILF